MLLDRQPGNATTYLSLRYNGTISKKQLLVYNVGEVNTSQGVKDMSNFLSQSNGKSESFIMTFTYLYPFCITSIFCNSFSNSSLITISLTSVFFCCLPRHVQINNESAIEFYKHFGFEIIETKQHYYKRIEPAEAHVLQKTLKRSECQETQVESKEEK